MRSSVKKALIAAAILCVVGLVVGIVGFSLMGYSFDDLKAKPLTENTYTFTEEINMFGIYTDTADVELILTDGDETKVVCRESEKEKYNVWLKNDMLVNGILYVEEVYSQRKWYDYIEVSSIFGTQSPSITVYLPKTEYDGSQIETDTGDTTIPAGLTFTSLVAKTDTGDININASIKDVLWIGTDTGDVTVEGVSAGTLKIETDTGFVNLISAEVSGTVILEADTGDTQLQNVRGTAINAKSNTGDVVLYNTIVNGAIKIETNTGDVKLSYSSGGVLDITTDTGDVKFSYSDADTLSVKTNTGDVSGNLLTDKIFLVETDTGRVNVPKSITGGKCEITTDTGDIDITVEKP